MHKNNTSKDCHRRDNNNNNNNSTKDNLARYSTHSEEGVIKLKTGYSLVPQDHGLIPALETLSKHYVRTIIIIIII